jgi:hypothetical protein
MSPSAKITGWPATMNTAPLPSMAGGIPNVTAPAAGAVTKKASTQPIQASVLARMQRQ